MSAEPITRDNVVTFYNVRKSDGAVVNRATGAQVGTITRRVEMETRRTGRVGITIRERWLAFSPWSGEQIGPEFKTRRDAVFAMHRATLLAAAVLLLTERITP